MRSILTLCSALLIAALASSSTFAQQKTVRACTDEWRANRAENQAKGVTLQAYVAQCRRGTAQAAPTVAPPATTAAPPASTAAPPATAPARPAPIARTPAPAQPLGANQFTSEAQAKARCPAGTVVWANLKSNIYHFSGGRAYGHTKSGAYMCEQDAQSAGMRAAKNEKRPS
jgi:hypothetical protein